jgi:UDP-glucose 4-epimerase
LNLFQAAVDYGVKKIICASTGGAIYGEQETFPADENHPTKPLSPYAISKLAVEKYLYFYKKSYGIDYVILRYANVYGPRQNPLGEAGVVSIFCESMLHNKQPVINGDGKQTRDYVFVEDVVNANIRALGLKASETINIGTSVETDVNYLFDFINKYFGSKFKKVHGEPKAGEQIRSVIGYEKAREILNWKLRYNVGQGLEKTCEWFKNNI